MRSTQDERDEVERQRWQSMYQSASSSGADANAIANHRARQLNVHRLIGVIEPESASDIKARTSESPTNNSRDALDQASSSSIAFAAVRAAVAFAAEARVNGSLGLDVAAGRALAGMRGKLAIALEVLLDPMGHCSIPGLDALSVDLTIIAIATAAAPPDPAGCGLTAGTAGFLISPSSATPAKLGLSLARALQARGLNHVVGDDALAELVPTTKLKNILQQGSWT